MQEERPDVMDKLMGIVNQMDEIEEKARQAGAPRHFDFNAPQRHKDTEEQSRNDIESAEKTKKID